MKKYYHILRFGLHGILLLILLSPLWLYLLFLFQYHFGFNYKGVSHYFDTAMKEGNGKEAVYWAKKLMAFRRITVSPVMVGYAYELNGEYERALEVYENYPSKYSSVCEFQITRIKFKLNQREEAFRGYCQSADRCLEQNKELLSVQRLEHQRLEQQIWALEQRSRALGRIRYGFTMENDRFMRLSPFLEYRVFLDFMEEEYQKLCEPPEYAAAMELFRAIDTEIDEKHLPRSYASDRLDAMRKQILAERKKKGVKW